MKHCQWEKQYQYLIQYKDQFDQWPTKSTIYPKGNPLGKWYDTQKKHYKMNTLTPKQALKLVHAKCCFMTDKEKWALQYEWLEEYLELNNNNLPEKQTQYPEGNFLGTWWNIQKRLIKTNTIPQEHKNALNKLIKNSLPNR